MLRLLTLSHQSRDQVCLIIASGDRAEVVVPPTRCVALAASRLERLPCGGGTPLAHALSLAARVGVRALAGREAGRV